MNNNSKYGKFTDNDSSNKNISSIDFSSAKIKFSGDEAADLAYKPDKFTDSFYQICQYKNEKTKLYPVRKVIFNERYEPKRIFEKEYDAKTLKKFMHKNSNNKYKVYPINDLSFLSQPNSSDFMCRHSDLTKNKINNGWNYMQCFDSYNDYAYHGIQNTHTMASPGADISVQKRKVGSAPKQFYDGAPTDENLFQINNNLIGKNVSKYKRF